MTDEEVRLKVKELLAHRRDLHERATAAARPVVPVLLDSGRTESAKPLQEIFFQLDALDQEMADFVVLNYGQMLKALMPK